MAKILLIFLGGGCGSVMRYLISDLSKYMFGSMTTHAGLAGTFVCNILGCLLIGLFNGYSARFGWSEHTRLMLTVGLCGGFTTFSTFSNEGLQLLQSGNYTLYAIYTIMSVVSGVGAVLLAM